MGILDQMRALSVQQQPYKPTCSASKGEALPCQQQEQGDDSLRAAQMEPMIQLPEDILHQIHALMPMRDAAQAACVSPAFLRSWRCYPKLILTLRSLGIKDSQFGRDEIARNFIDRVDHIMQNHSGKGLKTFKLGTYPCSNLHPSYLDRWLEAAITPGIAEFEFVLTRDSNTIYTFPGSLLSSERTSSIWSFVIAECSFHCSAQVGCMNSLTNLELYAVHVTGEELHGFLSNSCALKKIVLVDCNDIVCLKIPVMQQLNILDMANCQNLEMIDSNAPNISTFFYTGHPIHISLGAASQVRRATICGDCHSTGMLCYASTKLPFVMPNLRRFALSTAGEKVDTPMAMGKFLQLKHLEIVLYARFSPYYDFLSLVSFLNASPALETFILRIGLPTIRHDSIVQDSGSDSFHPRCPSEYCHVNLKTVLISGFCSAKSMIELTIHIIEKAKSLECLTLDTTRRHDQRSAKAGRCLRLCKDAVAEAEKARIAIRRYVEGRVPVAVNLKIIEPCSKCIY